MTGSVQGTSSERGANVLDSERAAELGKASGRARRKLTVADVERELGSLETPADAKRWLRQAYVWAAAQLLSGSAGNACVGACREWLKAHAEQVDIERVKALEARLRELEGELAARAGRPRMVP